MVERQNYPTGWKSRLVSLFPAACFALLAADSSFGQAAPIPEYVAALVPFEVARLDGNLAPANGNISMQDITPAEWLASDPGNSGLGGVITAWNGGAKSVGEKLFVHGGGHTDSANNGIYIYDFSGTSRPTGWTTPLLISSVSAVRSNNATYSDGLPTAVHTYDGLVHATHNNHLYRFGGSQYNNGFMEGRPFKYSVSGNRWTRLPNYPSNNGGAKTLYDPATGKIFVTMNDALEGHFFRTDSETWSGSKGYSGNGFPFNAFGVWDTSRNRGLIIGDGERSLVDIDFENETVSVSGISVSGASGILGSSGISAVYDPVADIYWIFGGGTSSSGWSNLYRLNADGPPWTMQSVSFTGSQIERTRGMIGSWGRFVFMPAWRAIGVIASETSPAFIIRLPGEAAPSPEPPTDLRAN